MANERSKLDDRGAKARRVRPAGMQKARKLEPLLIEAERSGDWMPAEELRTAALGAVETGNEVTLNLGGIDYLDASALQILLALGAEQKKRGRRLEVAGASPHLRQWFEYAGAVEVLFHDGAEAR